MDHDLVPLSRAPEHACPPLIIYLAPASPIWLDGEYVPHKGAVIEYREDTQRARGIIRLEDDRVLAVYAPEWEVKRRVDPVYNGGFFPVAVIEGPWNWHLVSRGQCFYVDGVIWDDIDPERPALPSGLMIPGEL